MCSFALSLIKRCISDYNENNKIVQKLLVISIAALEKYQLIRIIEKKIDLFWTTRNKILTIFTRTNAFSIELNWSTKIQISSRPRLILSQSTSRKQNAKKLYTKDIDPYQKYQFGIVSSAIKKSQQSHVK